MFFGMRARMEREGGLAMAASVMNFSAARAAEGKAKRKAKHQLTREEVDLASTDSGKNGDLLV